MSLFDDISLMIEQIRRSAHPKGCGLNIYSLTNR